MVSPVLHQTMDTRQLLKTIPLFSNNHIWALGIHKYFEADLKVSGPLASDFMTSDGLWIIRALTVSFWGLIYQLQSILIISWSSEQC